MDNLRKYAVIIIATTALLGILLAAFPDKMLAYTAFIIGGAFIICGALEIINYISEAKSKFRLALGVSAVVVGVITCAAYRQIVSVIVFVLGAFLLVGGIVNLVNSFYIAVKRHRSWILTVVFSIASIVLGVVSLRNPFETQTKIVQFLGAALIFFAVFDTVVYFQLKKAFIDADQRISNGQDSYNAHEVDFTEVDE